MIGLPEPDGRAELYVRCTADEEQSLALVWWTGDEPICSWATFDHTVLSSFFNHQCGLFEPSASPAEDPPVLPLTLESGGLGLDVLATAGPIRVNTANASGQAGYGTRFEADYDPDQGKSRFHCLAGSVQVQPTAAGAPPLTLGPGQFVEVTAAGAGPIGEYHYVYLPFVLR
jgi:hypothetical protein